ncbi:MAG TPA: hypothetical protein VM537_07030 [Anaerolineae bacterium]|nr:hypothetical protein [Anaerolineae bacterium]
MAHHYSPRMFLRQAPNALLGAYFARHGQLSDLPWETLKETDVDPIYEAWQALPKEERDQAELDFQVIDDMASAEGVMAIIEEGHFHGEDLRAELETHEGFHQKAFWTFLERSRIFEVASLLDQVDRMNRRYLLRRKDMPRDDPDLSLQARAELELSLSALYDKRQGRGRRCRMEPYLRAGRYHYIFAYLDDYVSTFVGYGPDGQFERHPQRKAFEVVFIYDPVDGTLDLYTQAEGDKQFKTDLQQLFSRVFLHQELPPQSQGSHSYELNGLKSRDFPFPTDPADGVVDVRVRKLRLVAIGNARHRITLEGDPSGERDDIYGLMEQALNHEKLPLSAVNVTHASIRMLFAMGRKRPKSVSFEISFPNHCNLKDNSQHRKAKAYLKQWGIARV